MESRPRHANLMGCGRKVVAGSRWSRSLAFYCAGQGDLGAGNHDLGVFSGFLKICSLLRQENRRFPAFFPAIWAFLKHLQNFVPFFTLPTGVRKGQKGTNLKNIFKNAHEPPSGGP